MMASRLLEKPSARRGGRLARAGSSSQGCRLAAQGAARVMQHPMLHG